MSRKHRLCRKCGKSWNVSSVSPGGKKYICPWCAWKEKRKSARGTAIPAGATAKKHLLELYQKEDSNVKFITGGHRADSTAL